MSIILRYLMNNIREKKLRSFLILLAIVLSTALYFASNAVSASFTDTIVGQLKSFYGQATITFSPNKDATFQYISENVVRPNPDIEMVMGVNNTSGTWEKEGEKDKIRFNLFGSDMEKLIKLNPFETQTHYDLKGFTGRKIIVSEGFQEKYGLHIGDSLPLKVNNTEYRFKIVAIGLKGNIFGNESRNYLGLVPNDTLAEMLGGNGKYTTIYAKTKKNIVPKTFADNLDKTYKVQKIKVSEAVNAADIQSALNNITLPFMMVSIMVLIMSIFIIFTSFKVTMLERLPVLGTFRSIGATQKMTRNVLLGESLIYGALGGMIGVPVGILILKIMLSVISSLAPQGSMKVALSLQPSNIIGCMILAVLISFVSAYIPIRKASRLPLKDVVLGTVAPPVKGKYVKLILGVLLYIASLVLPFIVPSSLVGLVGGVAIFTLVTSTLFITPLLVRGIIFILEPFYDKIFGNEGLLAIKNMKNNDNINQNIGLLILGISTLLTVTMLSNTMQTLITNESSGAKYEVMTMGSGLNRDLVKKIKLAEGVEKVYPIYEAQFAKIKDTGKSAMEIFGSSANEVMDFFELTLTDNQDPAPLLLKLQEERTLILRKEMLGKYECKVGDSLVFETPKGPKSYRIIAISIKSPAEMMAGENFVKNDFDLKNYLFAAIKSKSPEQSVTAIKDIYATISSGGGSRGNFNYTTTWVEYIEQGKKMYGILFGIMQGFAVVLLVIGIFGIINNLIINFLERRSAIAIYKSVGMSRAQLKKTTLIEALNAGLFGSLFGIITTLLEIMLAKRLMFVLIGNVPIVYPVWLFVAAFVLGIAITMLGSIAPLLKGDKLEIIAAIKYE
ncbi:MAG: ABC transporter permease [Hyphomonadaceae bacterium]|nr:ABC transporter permease [Clostridia bacterium]